MNHIEATAAAKRGNPICYKDQEYSRIIAIGIKYPEPGAEPIPFVTLIDKNRRSVVDVNPRDCEALPKKRNDRLDSAVGDKIEV